MTTTDPAEFLQSDRLLAAGFRHAFFTRRGGASAGAYATLNFSVGVGDRAADVEENFERAARALGVARAQLFCLSQVHGDTVVELTADATPDATLRREGDALVAWGHELGRPAVGAAEVAVGVRVADCVPVLLGDRASGSVAAVHAGWRGVAANVVGAAVARMRAVVGPRLELVTAIGPHISASSFEVGDDLAATLAALAPEVRVLERAPSGRAHVDLRALVRAELREAGLADAAIDDVAGCTVAEPELFYSFRRDGAASGRHLAAIVRRG